VPNMHSFFLASSIRRPPIKPPALKLSLGPDQSYDDKDKCHVPLSWYSHNVDSQNDQGDHKYCQSECAAESEC